MLSGGDNNNNESLRNSSSGGDRMVVAQEKKASPVSSNSAKIEQNPRPKMAMDNLLDFNTMLAREDERR